MLARKTAAQATERTLCLAKRAAPRMFVPFISAPDDAYLAPSGAEVNEMMPEERKSAYPWRGGHRAFTAGQIEASLRSRTFCLQIAAKRRDTQLFEPGAPISRLLGGARINLDLQNRVSRLMDTAALDTIMSPDDPKRSHLACAERPSGRPAPPRHPGEVPRSESRLEPGGNRHDGGAPRRPL